MNDKPDIQRGDVVQLRGCPVYTYENHKAKVLSEPHLYKGKWEVSVRYYCTGSAKNAIVNAGNLILIKRGFMSDKTPWYFSKKAINIYIIIGVVLILWLIISATLGGVNNTYVNKSQQVSTAQSNIYKEEQRRVDLFNNLADAVQSAKNFEGDTQTKIAQARGQANAGNVDQAMLTINAVTEAYPEIKSIDLYKQTMLEFSATENRLAQYRESYNTDVKDYNAYVQGFPSGMWLSLLHKDKTPAKYFDSHVNNKDARNLFK
jgi:LemA protein